MMFGAQRRLGALFAALGVVLVSGGLAVAAVPHDSGVIHVCLRDNGTWRVNHSPGEVCKSNETATQVYSKSGADAAFQAAGATAGGDLRGTYPDPVIAADAVTGAEVLDESLTGRDVVESGLGQVPRAASAQTAAVADNADRLDGADASDLVLHCPAEMVRSGDVCLDAPQRPAGTWSAAYFECLNRGLRLPSVPELSAGYRAIATASGDETNWTDEQTSASDAIALRLVGFAVGFQNNAMSQAVGYRCVTSPTNSLGRQTALRRSGETLELVR